MSLHKSSLVGDDFTKALKKEPGRRSTMDLQTLFYTLRALDCLSSMDDNVLYTICTYCTYSVRSANDILYCRGEVVSSWYILISGSVFIDGSMFLPIVSFGRRSPSQSRRTNECLILEPSEMIVIDYIDYSPVPRSIGSLSSNRNSQSSDTSSAYSGSDTIGSLRSDDMDLSGLVEANVDSDDEDDLADSMEELTVRDAVRECLEKDPAERTEHDIHVLLEFTQHLNAFNDLTITTRRALCQVMVFAVVEKAGTIVLNDNEELDSWSVLVHGSVEIRDSAGTTITLSAGDSFGLPPTLDKQYFQGEMRTTCDDCQFVCVTQDDYYRIQKQGLDNQTHHHRDSKLVLITETKTENSRIVHVIIRGTEAELMEQLVTMEHPSSDPTYVEDYLLTHRVFESSDKLARKLIDWFNDVALRDRVTRVMLLWVNNHFVDFEGDTHLMAELVRFHSLLEATQDEMMGQLRLLQIACSAKSRPRTLTLSRASRDDPLPFNIMGGADSGYGIYVNSVEGNINLRPGDEILEVNNICFKEISLGKGYEILKNATHLCLVVKCNFMGYYECLHSKIPLTPRNPVPMPPTQAITLKQNKSKKERLFDKLIKGFLPKNGLDVVDNMIEQSTNKIDYPENVLKVYRSDQSFKYFLVNRETTAREVVMLAIQEFVDLNTSNSRDFALFQVSAPGSVLKQGRLPDTLDSLAERLPLGSRYYIKNLSSSEQLLPDEQLPELAKEGEVSLLTLSPSALALQLTLSDYSIFRQIEMTEYIDDLFNLKTSYGTPNLINFANLVNRETFWVVTEILKEGNVNKRVGIIKRFIKIATQCRECRNFNSMFNIISGLGHSSITRLKLTWEKVSGKWKRCFNEMQELMDPSRNMGKYRTLLAQSFGQTPMIPFYPVVKKDLTFIDLGNSTHLDSLVNFEKMRMISKEIRGLVQMSAAPFDTSSQPTMAAMNQLVSKGNNLTTTTGKRRKKTTGPVNIKKMYEEMHMVRKVKAYLTKLCVISDETELFNLSFTIEPNPMETTVKNKTGTIQRRPGSPTLSTSSSASSESKKKFGTGSPGSYQKLMSLSEAKTKVYSGKNNVRGEVGSSVIISTSTQPSPVMGGRKPSVEAKPSTDSARLLLSIESSSVLPGKS